MSRILALAPSGFGKSTGTGKIDDDENNIHFQGLPTESSYILSVTSKPLPYRGSAKQWPVADGVSNANKGRRLITKTVDDVIKALDALLIAPPIKNIVLDDLNYLMQDWFMDNALRSGWDAPKKIGYDMGKLFKAVEKFEGYEKNIIVLAHGEPVTQPDGRIYMKLKTTGKMVDEYVTPEGKFDIVLVGRSRFDTGTKTVVKEYVTNEDEQYSSPKSPIGMFKDKYVSNDLGPIIETINKYYLGE